MMLYILKYIQIVRKDIYQTVNNSISTGTRLGGKEYRISAKVFRSVIAGALKWVWITLWFKKFKFYIKSRLISLLSTSAVYWDWRNSE